MSVEYEYRYSSDEFDFKSVVKRAKELGGGRIRWSHLVNHIYSLPGVSGDIVRVRELHGSGSHEYIFTMKTKINKEFPTEHECKLSDPIAIQELLKVLHVPKKHTIEKLRGSIKIPGHGILDFDWNPGLPMVLEVECTSKKSLDVLIRELGLKKPSAEMHKRAVLEGQYEQHLGIELRNWIQTNGLEFERSRHQLNAMITDEARRKMFNKTYKSQTAQLEKMKDVTKCIHRSSN